MPTEIEPQDSSRAATYKLWLNAPNPMVTFFKTLDVTNLVKVHENSRLKFNMLITYCVGKAACDIKEFFTLPVGEKLIRYNDIAVNTIVKNKFGEVNSCDILFSKDLNEFKRDYLNYTSRVAESCQDRDLSADCMVIGTSAVIETELDGVVGMNSGIFNNPFMTWGRYRKNPLGYFLPVSFQFHHTQMDGAHAGKFLERLQSEINTLQP